MLDTFLTPASPCLVIDGSGPQFCGSIDSGASLARLQDSARAASRKLVFYGRSMLTSANLELDSIRNYIYCEGPGSVLGLRLCAMALETWRRLNPNTTQLHGYNSLHLAAICSLDDWKTKGPSLLISDWKKGAWNSVEIRGGTIGDVRPITTEDVDRWDGPLYHLPARKGWQAPPEGADPVFYQPEKLPQLIKQAKPATANLRDRASYSAGANIFQKVKS